MKKLLIGIAVLLMLSGLNAELRIVRAKNGKDLSIEALAKDLRNYDVIFFGEEHGTEAIHALQRELLPHLMQPKRKLVLSFEMWERDTQDALDSFLAGSTSEDIFIEESRVWPKYSTDYRPLIMFAKEHKLPAIAANVPREYAGRTARASWDFVQDLPPEQRKLIATDLSAPKDAYRAAFLQTMQGMGSHLFDQESLENYYQAQCMKDDTMAESIYIALDYYQNAQVIHFNGAFHSRDFLGTVSRLQKALPKLKIAVITPIRHSNWQSMKVDQKMRASGTHLILLEELSAEEEE
jgi:uncharacterized iron-regulated protein